MPATAHRNGGPVPAAPSPPPPVEELKKPLTQGQRIADLERRLGSLETQFRNFIAQQMLRDPAVQARLQAELVARLEAQAQGD